MPPWASSYRGLSSAYWYDAAQFHELLLACGAQPVRALIAQLDGCSGGKAGEIVAGVGLGRTACQDVTPRTSRAVAQGGAQAIPAGYSDRLGAVGRNAYPGGYYAIERGIVSIGADAKLQAMIPYVVEVWAREDGAAATISWLTSASTGRRAPVTSTPITDDKEISIYGSGLRHGVANAPKKGAFQIHINVTTPFCPITSDGKAPDLDPFSECDPGLRSPRRRARRNAPRPMSGRSAEGCRLREHDGRGRDEVSGNGEDDFNSRQILYRMRPIVKEAIDQTLTTKNFNKILTDYENDNGEIDGMYRDPRGSISHPHTGDIIPLGTRTVENYERPVWEFNKILIHREGGFQRGSCEGAAGISGTIAWCCRRRASRRVLLKDLVDKLAEHDEPVTVFSAHDADASGTMINQTLQEATAARGARKIKIVNIGLEPWEAIAMGFDAEEFEQGETKSGEDRRRPVAQYVRDYDEENGTDWVEWLQTNRVELNAMTTPQLIEWLDRKMAEHGAVKLIPPSKVIADEFEDKLADAVRAAVIERILREAKAEQQISKALRKIKRPTAPAFTKGIKAMFAGDAKRPWRDFIKDAVRRLTARVAR